MSFKSKFTNRHETILWYVKKREDGSIRQPYLDVDEVREKSREKDPRNNLFGRNPGNVYFWRKPGQCGAGYTESGE